MTITVQTKFEKLPFEVLVNYIIQRYHLQTFKKNRSQFTATNVFLYLFARGHVKKVTAGQVVNNSCREIL